MPDRSIRFRHRILLWILLPVVVVGTLVTVISFAYLTPPLVAFIEDHLAANLKLASRLGVETCENNFNTLLELRLENDLEMNLAMRKESLEEIKDISRQMPNVHMFIFDRQRRLQTSSMTLADTVRLPTVTIGKDDIITENLGEMPVVMHYRYFPFWDWVIVSAIPASDYHAPIRLAKTILYAGNVGVLASVVITLWLVFLRFVNAPLKKLIEATKGVAEGRFTPLSYRRVDEMGRLIDAFNVMIARLAEDDTKLQRLLHQLQMSEKRFRMLFENAPIGIGVVSAGGKLIMANGSLLQLLGIAKVETADTAIRDFFEAPERYTQRADRVMRQAEVNQFEIQMKSRQATLFDARLTLGTIQLNDESVVLLTAEDITRQKHLESQLQQAQKMEAIGTLAGGVAHDFNNILTAIIGFSELALDQAADGSTQQANIQEIITAGDRARDLVKQILTFARQNASEKKPVQVSLIIKEALRFLRSSLPTTIAIQQDIQSDANVMADPTQIYQVIMNLCTNSAHAMRETGGVLHIGLAACDDRDIPSVRHPELMPARHLKLTVGDTGHGIAPELLGRIFDPYFTTKSAGEGTGMGLSVVQGIVQSCNGAITVDSIPGDGSTFTIYLPILEKQAEAAAGGPVSLPSGNERILLVDDEPPIVRIGKQMLENLGYRVTTRTSSVEALQLFQAEPFRFDLVITDMTMPNMTGDHLAAEMLRTRPGMPIVLCTGYSDRIDSDRAAQMGIGALIYKPLVKKDLALIVRRMLDTPPPPA